MQYLRTLKDISTNMDEVKGKAGVLAQLQEEQLQSQIELQNALSGLFDATGGNFETLTTQAKVFVNQGLTAIIKGVIDVVNYLIELYNESVLIRAIWNGIVAGFKTTFDTLGNLFGFFVDIVKATGTALKGAFTLDFDDVKKGLADYAAAYGNLVKAQVKDITENFQEGLEGMQKKIKPYEERFHGESENSCIYLGYKSDAYYKKKQKMHPEITCEKLEYVYVGAEFNRKILKYGGIMIHSSAVEVDGKAYLFSAPCGTGKSTHTKQWQKYFGADQAIIINDDKPVLRRLEDGWYAYGTPFSGKTDENVNKKVKLQGICMLERGENRIRQIQPAEAIPLILQQTIRPKNEKYLGKMMEIMDQLLREVPVYRMQCDISEEAVKMSYEAMKG